MLRRFSGKARQTGEGRLKWFPIAGIPCQKMWDDDGYWLPYAISGLGFDHGFVYDSGMRRVNELRLANVRGRSWRG